VRPRIVQGWLNHGNLAAAAATWLSGVLPQPRLAWNILGSLPDFSCCPSRLRRIVGLGARLSPLVHGILYNSRLAADSHRRFGYRARLTHLFSDRPL
jgi:hypothetical protein